MKAQDLLGTWSLVSQIRTHADGRVQHPMGEKPVGSLTYSPDGRMSVAIMAEGRAKTGADGFRGLTVAQKAEAAAGYLSYAGTFRVEGDTVIHDVEISLFPDWVGTAQRRRASLEGDTLTLSAGEFTMTWKKVQPRPPNS